MRWLRDWLDATIEDPEQLVIFLVTAAATMLIVLWIYDLYIGL